MSLQGKHVAVAGGCGLLGRAIVSELLDCGAQVTVLDVAEPEDKTVAWQHFDIKDIASCESLIENLPRMDGWVNCAYPRTQDWGLPLESIPAASFHSNLIWQLGNVCLTSRTVAEKMKREGGGSLVHLASIYGVMAPDFSLYEGLNMTCPAAYSAIKGGLIQFSKYLAAYYASHQVRVNCVSPGGVEDGQNPEFIARYNKRTPLGRMARPEDISPTVAFLLSDAASYVTGENILIDGGFVS